VGEGMKSSENDHNHVVIHAVNFSEAYAEEVEFGEDISNQWSLKLKKIESINKSNRLIKDSSTTPIDIKRNLLLKNDGKAFITFDVSYIQKYSICIINSSENCVSYCVELSPDNVHYMRHLPFKDIQPNQLDCIFSEWYIKFVRIKIYGKSSSSVIVFLQGMK